MEHWIEVKKHPDYEVSNLGNVRKKGTGRLLSQSLNRPGGYQRVRIDGQIRYVHRLVYDSFIDGDHSNLEIIHVDGDRKNNNVSNLQSQERKGNRGFVPQIIRCRDCIHRGRNDFCTVSDDDFWCADGKLF